MWNESLNLCYVAVYFVLIRNARAMAIVKLMYSRTRTLNFVSSLLADINYDSLKT